MGQALTITRDIDIDQFDRALKHEKNASVVRRLQSIRLLLNGATVPEAAEQLGTPERTLRRWVHRFNAEGTDGIHDRDRPGQPPKLAPELENDFKERIRVGAKTEDGVCTLRGEQIRAILAKEYNANYSLGGVYFLLHRLGFSSLVPRPYHPARDLDAQEEFKKTFSRRH